MWAIYVIFKVWENSLFFLTNWSAKRSTVFKENRRLQKLNKSSIDGPNKSITSTLCSPSLPYHRANGIPTPPANVLYTRASYSNCGWVARTLSSLTATSSPLAILDPKKRLWNKIKIHLVILSLIAVLLIIG